MKEIVTEKQGRYINNGYYDYDICKECKGKNCCAHFGCMYSAQDFIVLRDEKYTHDQRLMILTELLKQGNISIDMCWMKDRYLGPLHPITKRPDIDKISDGDGALYLRARNKDRPIIDFQYFLEEGKHYPCKNWDPEKGCQFSEEERPYGGRMLKPIAVTSGDITIHTCETVGEDDAIKSWLKHQLLLYELYLNILELNLD